MVQACTTPRDQRIAMLSSYPRIALRQRAKALGYQLFDHDDLSITRDELVSMILDAETDLGMVAR